MNLKEIKELIALMNENELMELEVERDGMKIRLRKSSSGRIETIMEEHAVSNIGQVVKAGDRQSNLPQKSETL
ncbi:MAG: hypothetical protein AAB157_02425 [Candidatus Omnitrophota bacterium]